MTFTSENPMMPAMIECVAETLRPFQDAHHCLRKWEEEQVEIIFRSNDQSTFPPSLFSCFPTHQRNPIVSAITMPKGGKWVAGKVG